MSTADDDIIAAYAVAKLPRSLDPQFVVCFRPEIDRARGWSSSPNSPYWTNFLREAAANVPTKKLLRLLPQPAGMLWDMGIDADESDEPMMQPGGQPQPAPQDWVDRLPVDAETGEIYDQPEDMPVDSPPKAAPADPAPASESPF